MILVQYFSKKVVGTQGSFFVGGPLLLQPYRTFADAPASPLDENNGFGARRRPGSILETNYALGRAQTLQI